MAPPLVVTVYLVLYVLAILPLVVPVPPNGPLAGVFAILLASPWFQIIQPRVNNLAISFLLSGALNAGILYSLHIAMRRVLALQAFRG
jgi:hypothetical protein